MKPLYRRSIKAALITIISAAILLAAAGPILSGILNKKIKAKLEASNIHIGSLSVNLFTRSITIKDINWADKAVANSVYAGGLRIMPLLRDKKISVRHLVVEGGWISVTIDTTSKNNQQPDSINFKSIDIDRITISDIAVKIKRDTVIEYQATVGLVLHYIALDSLPAYRDAASYTFRNIETTVRDLRIHRPGSLYSFKVKQASFDKERKTLHVDSLELEPLLNKADWAKAVKSQETRTSLLVGSFDAAGVNMGVHMQDTAIMMTSLTIDGLVIHAYKNKKYPFTRKEKFPLPMESFRALGVGIEVDSIKMQRGTITYEELPEEGFHYAWIRFEDVEATMSSLNNRDFKNMSGYSTLEASAHLMKTGEIKATFRLPLEPKKRYTAEGTITNVPLKELNPLLKDIAFIEIASGKLNKMKFEFTYDDISSEGQLHFDYEDLRMLSLKKERNRNVNEFKTILVNTAVKNDKTLDGEIKAIRNQKKAVFTLWTQSIVSGLKSALMPRNGAKKSKGK